VTVRITERATYGEFVDAAGGHIAAAAVELALGPTSGPTAAMEAVTAYGWLLRAIYAHTRALFASSADFDVQLGEWLGLVNQRSRRALGCAPSDRIGADRAAMIALPPQGIITNPLSLPLCEAAPVLSLVVSFALALDRGCLEQLTDNRVRQPSCAVSASLRFEQPGHRALRQPDRRLDQQGPGLAGSHVRHRLGRRRGRG
jgi:hypothetical protein